MKTVRLALSICCLFLLTHCGKDEPIVEELETEQKETETEMPKEEEVEQFELEVYFTYSTYSGNADNWIIIHNKYGDLIDYKKIENGGPIEFMAPKDSIPDEISITEMFYSKDTGNNQSHNLLTFTGIASGSVLNNFYTYPQANEIGSFDLRVDNIPGLKMNTLSTQRGPFNAGESTTEGNSINASLIMTNIPLFENEDYLLSIYDEVGEHKYTLLEKPDANSNFTFDYSEFLDYDEYLEVNLPQNSFSLLFTYGYKEENPNYFYTGQAFSNYLDFNSEGIIKAGYLDGCNKYRTDFSIRLDGFTYGFSKAGEKVEEITIPTKPTFNLEESSIYDLRFTTNLNFIKKETRYSSNIQDENGANTDTIWIVHSEGTSFHKVGNLPAEIVTKYSDINLEKIELNSITLSTQGFNQQETFNQRTSLERTGDKIVEGYSFSF